MDSTKDFYGCGWSYPVGVDKASGRVRLSRYEDDIREAIQIILSTRPGERIMRPEFGSRLHEYAFAPDGYGTRSRIAECTQEALRLWEPRITDIEVGVDFPGGAAGGFVLDIAYVVRTTNNPFNLVYPYYLTEGL